MLVFSTLSERPRPGTRSSVTVYYGYRSYTALPWSQHWSINNRLVLINISSIQAYTIPLLEFLHYRYKDTLEMYIDRSGGGEGSGGFITGNHIIVKSGLGRDDPGEPEVQSSGVIP